MPDTVVRARPSHILLMTPTGNGMEFAADCSKSTPSRYAETVAFPPVADLALTTMAMCFQLSLSKLPLPRSSAVVEVEFSLMVTVNRVELEGLARLMWLSVFLPKSKSVGPIADDPLVYLYQIAIVKPVFAKSSKSTLLKTA